MHGAGSPTGPGRTGRRGAGGWLYVRGGRTGVGPPSALVATPKKSVRPSWRESGFFILAVLDKEGLYKADTQDGYRPDGPIAQLDRVTDFYSVGCRFESCWDRHFSSAKTQTNQSVCPVAQTGVLVGEHKPDKAGLCRPMSATITRK